MDPNLSDRFWSRSIDEALSSLGTSRQGLATSDAVRRAEAEGGNIVAESPRRRILAKIGKRLIEPLIAILIVAGAEVDTRRLHIEPLQPLAGRIWFWRLVDSDLGDYIVRTRRTQWAL